MYYEYFGLSQPPFRITPNTEFFYGGAQRGPILEALIYAITRGEGIIKVTGEVGSGKTMLCHMLQARLPPHIETVYIANPSVPPEEILHAIAFELQIAVPRGAPRVEVIQALHDYLLERHGQGKRVVVFVEESQSMPLATLEEIRLLSNLETRNDKLLQIVLFGQPELDERLRRPEIRPLRERITHSFRLDPLSPAEIREYLMFRMRTAGYRGPELFSGSVARRIARASRGLTRRVNLLADKALLAAFSENTHTIRPRHVAAAVRDSEFAREGRVRAPRSVWAEALLAAGAALGVGAYTLVTHYSDAGTPVPAAPVSGAHAPAPGEPPVPAPPAPPPAPVAAAEQPAVASGEEGASEPRARAGRRAGVADLLAARLAATEEWLAAENGANYTIQLLGASDPEQLKRHLNDLAKLIEMNKLFVYRTVARQRPSLTVLYGSFGDRRGAKEALDKLPGSLKANRPFLRTVQGVRGEIERVRGS